MVLDVNGQQYTAHFSHVTDYEETGEFRGFRAVTVPRHRTFCKLHEGRCQVKGCACLPDASSYVGEAFCNPQDQFTRKIGRKLALARALALLPRTLRQQIWASYFKISPHR
jgi:hypothetical protein